MSLPKLVLKYESAQKEEMVNSNSFEINQPIPVEQAMIGILLLAIAYSAIKKGMKSYIGTHVTRTLWTSELFRTQG